jgi:hypothetical protein
MNSSEQQQTRACSCIVNQSVHERSMRLLLTNVCAQTHQLKICRVLLRTVRHRVESCHHVSVVAFLMIDSAGRLDIEIVVNNEYEAPQTALAL